jgi:hypothetical protein
LQIFTARLRRRGFHLFNDLLARRLKCSSKSTFQRVRPAGPADAQPKLTLGRLWPRKEQVMNATRIVFAVAALAAAGVRAQAMDEPSYAPPPDDRPTLVTAVGMSADIGGGVVRFIDRGISDITKAGGSWMARLTVGTRTHLGGELAYVGTASEINTIGLSDKAVLLSNGIEAVLRVNALTGMWQPYAIAGYTYRHYTIQNSSFNVSAVSSSDNISEIPVGVGLAWRNRGFIVDGRFTLHGAITPNRVIADTNLSSFGFDAKVGFEF